MQSEHKMWQKIRSIHKSIHGYEYFWNVFEYMVFFEKVLNMNTWKFGFEYTRIQLTNTDTPRPDHKAIFGPYTNPPYGAFTHVSPFITRDKPDSDKHRVIVDLSFPAEASVNAATPRNVYLNTVFKLQYPTMDHITRRLHGLGWGCQLYKVDLSHAFRQLHTDPMNYPLLCLKWSDRFFSDTCVPFGGAGKVPFSVLGFRISFAL